MPANVQIGPQSQPQSLKASTQSILSHLLGLLETTSDADEATLTLLVQVSINKLNDLISKPKEARSVIAAPVPTHL